MLHIQRGWGFLRGEFNEFVELLPAQQRVDGSWYQGTADAIYQNLDIIRDHDPKYVLVLAGDHIYKMDYGPMIAHHVESEAEITVGCIEVPRERAIEFGVMSVDEQLRVLKFEEKPNDPDPVPGRDGVALASMGIYVFSPEVLYRTLEADAKTDSSHDFGKDIIPAGVSGGKVFAYPFRDVKTRAQHYWRDVGNVDAFFEANMELVHVQPELNLYDKAWPIWTDQRQLPPAKFVLDEEQGRRGLAVNSMISGGCIVSGAYVNQSLLFSDVWVDAHTRLLRSVVLPGVRIGAGCRISNAIIDEGCVIEAGTVIGDDPKADADRFFVTNKGVVLVTPDMLGQITSIR